MRWRERRSLWWMALVWVVWVVAIPFVNTVDPVILGLPFLAVWVILAILVTPLSIWLASRGDPLFQADEAEEEDR
jgi:hypothetical protein